MTVVLQLIVRLPSFSPGGEKGISLYSGRTADRSVVAFGFFLKYRDLGFFLLFPEVKTEEKHGTQRQHGQQKLEEAFHRYLPPSFYLNPGKSQFAFSFRRRYIESREASGARRGEGR
jgi:hypothetical protein